MKSNSRNLIKVIKVILDVAWYGNIAIAVVAFSFLCYIFFFTPGNQYEEMSTQVHIGSHHFEKKVVEHTADVKDARLVSRVATLSYKIKSTPLVTASAFLLLISLEALFFLIIFHLRKLFRSLYQGEVFTRENANSLKLAGLFIMLILPVQLIVYGLEIFFIRSNFKGIKWFSVEPGFDYKPLIIGFTLYILAEIFDYGLQLKKENEEFV
jgi:hypothetical protein